jgi:hypothetical protein
MRRLQWTQENPSLEENLRQAPQFGGALQRGHDR